jgi:thiamine monophosphate synthase
MTLTLELPDDLAAQLEKLPPEQRNNYAVAALRAGVDSMQLQEEGRELQERRRKAQETVSLFNRAAATLKENDVRVAPAIPRAELYAERGP